MAKGNNGNIGGLRDEVKARFDSVKQTLELSNSSDTLALLLETFEQERVEAELGEEQAAGMRRVAKHLEDARRSMFTVLAGIQDENGIQVARLTDEIEAKNSRIEELEAECSELHSQNETLEARVVDLAAKAESVDALREQIAKSESANAERFDALLQTFADESKRHAEEVERLREAESKALGRVRELESELSEARKQVREMVTKENADEMRSDGE